MFTRDIYDRASDFLAEKNIIADPQVGQAKSRRDMPYYFGWRPTLCVFGLSMLARRNFLNSNEMIDWIFAIECMIFVAIIGTTQNGFLRIFEGTSRNLRR